MTRLCFETGHTDSRYHSNCVFPHPFRHFHALCIDAAVTGDAYWEQPFGSPAQKGWDEASARRFAPYPALCGASRCSVFVIACMKLCGFYHGSGGLSRGKVVIYCFFSGLCLFFAGNTVRRLRRGTENEARCSWKPPPG